MSTARKTDEKRNRVDVVVKDILRTTYSDFARTVGISRFRVANWKRRGGFPMNRKTLAILSEKTGLPLKAFLD